MRALRHQGAQPPSPCFAPAGYIGVAEEEAVGGSSFVQQPETSTTRLAGIADTQDETREFSHPWADSVPPMTSGKAQSFFPLVYLTTTDLCRWCPDPGQLRECQACRSFVDNEGSAGLVLGTSAVTCDTPTCR